MKKFAIRSRRSKNIFCSGAKPQLLGSVLEYLGLHETSKLANLNSHVFNYVKKFTNIPKIEFMKLMLLKFA